MGLPRDWLGPIAGVWIHHRHQRFRVFRDRFGRHPLQWISVPGGWAVTSCPQTMGSLSRGAVRPAAIHSFIHRPLDTDDRDLFDDVRRLRPGEVLDLRLSAPARRWRWWQPSARSVADPTAAMRGLLHRMGHGVGASPHILALSSGLDSATLGAHASTLHPQSVAYTLCDPLSIRDEGPAARHTASYLGLRWHPFSISHHPPFQRLSDLALPLAWGPVAHPDPSWKAPWHRHLRTRYPRLPLVYGNGADEALSSPPGVRSPPQLWRRAAHRLMPIATRRRLRQWLRPPTSIWLQPQRWIPCHISQVPPPTTRSDALGRQLWSWRWERILRSMAAESRTHHRPIWTPFLDAEFWDLSLSMDDHQMRARPITKGIMRRAMVRRLPDDCLQRSSQGGFDAVVERGLLAVAPPLVQPWLRRSRLASVEPRFDPAAFLHAYRAYRDTPVDPHSPQIRGSWPLWRTLSAEYWLRRF